MKSKTLVALLLVLSMAFVGCAETTNKENSDKEGSVKENSEQKEDGEESSGQEESKYPEYLNLDSDYPIIKDEYAGTIKLKVAICQDPGAGLWEDLWISKYLREKYNVEFEVESIPSSAVSDRINIMMSTGSMPDILINPWFSTTALVGYGTEGEQLLKMDEYIDETLTPHLYQYMQREDVKMYSTAADGHIYSAPFINDENQAPGLVDRYFVNRKWVDELGLEMPKTLDEFTNYLYAVKENDPAGVGSENVYPLGGGMDTLSNTAYLLNAFGYLTDSSYGGRPALRDGEVVIPAYDIEVYQEFLKLLNQYYEDGIINPNFFTIENTECLAQVANGQTAVYKDPLYVTGIETWNEWEAVYPLTSEWQKEPEWRSPKHISVGNFMVSADTEYPELCMRIADMYYNDEANVELWCGIASDEDAQWQFDSLRRVVNPETMDLGIPADQYPEDAQDTWSYRMQYLIGFMPQWGSFDTSAALRHNYLKHEGATEEAADRFYGELTEESFDVTNGDSHYRSTVFTNLVPYLTQGFPAIYYINDETTTKIQDLCAVIEPYIQEQVALFIVGERPLSEVADFAEELKSMGIDELLGLYQDIYESVVAN